LANAPTSAPVTTPMVLQTMQPMIDGVLDTTSGVYGAEPSFTQRNPRCCSDESAVQAIRALGR
jgi:hypothetical protein